MTPTEKREYLKVKGSPYEKPRDFYIPILVDAECCSIIYEYENDYVHKTFNSCQKLCDLRNNNPYFKDIETKWIVGKYENLVIVKEDN